MVTPKRQKVRARKKRLEPPLNKKDSIKTGLRFVGGLIILCAIAVGLIRLKYMFVDSDYFIIKGFEMSVTDEKGAPRNISLNAKLSDNILGKNIFFIVLGDLKYEIEAVHPEFKDVIVRRMLPDELIIEAKLRTAVAQLYSHRYYLIDEEGVLLPDIKNFPQEGVPIIIGLGVNLAKAQAVSFSKFERDKIEMALGVIKEIRSSGKFAKYTLKTIDVTDRGNLTFLFEDINPEIKIGSSDFAKRLKVLATVFEQLDNDITDFRYIDLRFEDPILGPR